MPSRGTQGDERVVERQKHESLRVLTGELNQPETAGFTKAC